MSPRGLSELERRDKWVAVAFMLLRVIILAALLVAIYYLLPAGPLGGAAALIRLAVGGLLFMGIIAWLVHRILKADLPGLKAFEGLALSVSVFLYLFATLYLSLSNSSSQAFSEPLNHTGALYMTITILATVGFGDIAPRTDLTRIIVSIQMMIDLVLVGLLVRIVVGAAKVGRSRESQPQAGQSEDQGQGDAPPAGPQEDQVSAEALDRDRADAQ